MSWRNGHPPINVQHKPAKAIPKKFHNPSVCAIGCFTKPGWKLPTEMFTRNAATRIAIKPRINFVSLNKMISLIPPTMQRRLYCAKPPTTKPAAKEIHNGA